MDPGYQDFPRGSFRWVVWYVLMLPKNVISHHVAGPMGVGAVFIATLAKISIPEGEAEKDTAQVDLLRESIQPIVFFLVLSSIVTRKAFDYMIPDHANG